MQKSETDSSNYDNWRARYSKLYNSRRSSCDVEDSAHRISFIGKEPSRYATLSLRIRIQNENQNSNRQSSSVTQNSDLITLLPEQNTAYSSYLDIFKKNDSRANIETPLLDAIRAKNQKIIEETSERTLQLPEDDVSEGHSSDICIHGYTMRMMTDRSVSRRSISRVSRISQRRDMDIPSILAFTAPVAPEPAPLENPAFQKLKTTQDEIPRWSIRRSMCPVCSQKWKDKSSIRIIKNSGLKRSTGTELPSVMAPARLRSVITTKYNPRPIIAAVDENKGIGAMRNSSATWQLTRARRFRTPKLQMPPPEATAPPSATAPMARKDLDSRVHRFLTDEGMTKVGMTSLLLKPPFSFKS